MFSKKIFSFVLGSITLLVCFANAQTMIGFKPTTEFTIHIDQVYPSDPGIGLISVGARYQNQDVARIRCTDDRKFPPVVAVGEREYFFDASSKCQTLVSTIFQNSGQGRVTLKLNNENSKVVSVVFESQRPLK